MYYMGFRSTWEGAILGIGAPIAKYRDFLPWAVQKRLNWSICRLGCGLGWAEEVQVQSYSPGGANVPSWQDALTPPGEYDWTIRLRQRCALSQITLTTCITFRVSRRRREMYKLIGHARVSVCVCMSVCPSLHAHTTAVCTYPGVGLTWGNGRGCPLIVHYWADLQSVHGFRCYSNIALNAKCQRVLVLVLCLVGFLRCTKTVVLESVVCLYLWITFAEIYISYFVNIGQQKLL